MLAKKSLFPCKCYEMKTEIWELNKKLHTRDCLSKNFTRCNFLWLYFWDSIANSLHKSVFRGAFSKYRTIFFDYDCGFSGISWKSGGNVPGWQAKNSTQRHHSHSTIILRQVPLWCLEKIWISRHVIGRESFPSTLPAFYIEYAVLGIKWKREV